MEENKCSGKPGKLVFYPVPIHGKKTWAMLSTAVQNVLLYFGEETMPLARARSVDNGPSPW